MSEAKVEITKSIAYYLEDVIEAKQTGKQCIHWTQTDVDSTYLEYLWAVRIRPIALKTSAVLFGILSIFSLLGAICSQRTIPNSVSAFFLAVHDPRANLVQIAIFIFFTLGYTAYITMWSIFQIRIVGLLELVPHRTTPDSLSFNVRTCARLAAPLAFFYLGWLSENGIKRGSWEYNQAPDIYMNVSTPIYNETSGQVTNINVLEQTSGALFMPSAFSGFYQLDKIEAFQQVLGVVFPIFLCCVIFLFLINMVNRILVYFKLDKYQFGAAIVTEEQLREGKRQLERQKRRLNETHKRNYLSRYIHNLHTKSKAIRKPWQFFGYTNGSTDGSKRDPLLQFGANDQGVRTSTGQSPLHPSDGGMEGGGLEGNNSEDDVLNEDYSQYYHQHYDDEEPPLESNPIDAPSKGQSSSSSSSLFRSPIAKWTGSFKSNTSGKESKSLPSNRSIPPSTDHRNVSKNRNYDYYNTSDDETNQYVPPAISEYDPRRTTDPSPLPASEHSPYSVRLSRKFPNGGVDSVQSHPYQPDESSSSWKMKRQNQKETSPVTTTTPRLEPDRNAKNPTTGSNRYNEWLKNQQSKPQTSSSRDSREVNLSRSEAVSLVPEKESKKGFGFKKNDKKFWEKVVE